MCYCGLNSSKIIMLQTCVKHALIMPSLHVFCKNKCTQEGAWLLYIFFQNHNYNEGTGKFIHKASILDSKWLFSNIIARS